MKEKSAAARNEAHCPAQKRASRENESARRSEPAGRRTEQTARNRVGMSVGETAPGLPCAGLYQRDFHQLGAEARALFAFEQAVDPIDVYLNRFSRDTEAFFDHDVDDFVTIK
jgi:hypothetical protein